MEVMDQKTVIVGNKGKDVRSDCQVTMELNESGGIQLTIDSRVQVMYGKAIRDLAEDVLAFFRYSACQRAYRRFRCAGFCFSSPPGSSYQETDQNR